MATRDLNDVNKQIFETRQHIDRQREAIQKFHEGSQIQAIPQAEDQLKTLEDRLGSLSKSADRRSWINSAGDGSD